MPTSAFIHGGIGEIELHMIPAARGKAFWPLHQQKLAADLYEQEHPGVTVKRPWEKEAEHAARMSKRKMPTLAPPELDMDPARAEPELRRRMQELGGLTVDHPEYEKLFKSLVKNIHQLERILGHMPTKFQQGVVPKKKEDDVSPELVQKLAKYTSLKKEETRRASIAGTEDLDFLALIRDNETNPDLRVLAVQRIEQVVSAERAVEA
jgi:hypothetical protein